MSHRVGTVSRQIDRSAARRQALESKSSPCDLFSKCTVAQRAPYLGTLAKRLCDKDSDVRKAAWRFFGGCGQEERAPYISSATAAWLGGSSVDQGEGACFSLGPIVARLGDEDPDVREAAWSFLFGCHPDERAPHLGAIAARLVDEDIQVREWALRLLGECSPGEQAPHVGALHAARLGDKRWKVRETSCEFENAL